MEKDFVPYKQTLELIELGISDFCAYQFYNINDGVLDEEMHIDFSSRIPAPLWQQAFAWFEEKFILSGEVLKQVPYNNVTSAYWWYMIKDSKGEDLSEHETRYTAILTKSHQDVPGKYIDDDKFNKFLKEDGFGFDTRNEAQLECLKQLIKICKNT